MSEIKNRKKITAAAAVLAVIFAAAFAFSVAVLKKENRNAVAYIYSDGRLAEKIDLSRLAEKKVIRIETKSGGYNIIEAEPGKIHVTEASCPDKICMKTGYISNGALPVSCLPNRLVIKIEGTSAESEPDIIVN